MPDNKEKRVITNALVVQKDVYMASLKALTILLETLGEEFEYFRTAPDIDKYYRKMLLSIVSNHIQAVGQISAGFGTCIESDAVPKHGRGYEH